jgi:transposase-like protein
MRVCPQCQRDRLVKNGSAAGKSKKLCQPCGSQFTRTTPRGKPLAMKVHAVLLYLSGISMHRIAFLVRVSLIETHLPFSAYAAKRRSLHHERSGPNPR